MIYVRFQKMKKVHGWHTERERNMREDNHHNFPGKWHVKPFTVYNSQSSSQRGRFSSLFATYVKPTSNSEREGLTDGWGERKNILQMK